MGHHPSQGIMHSHSHIKFTTRQHVFRQWEEKESCEMNAKAFFILLPFCVFFVRPSVVLLQMVPQKSKIIHLYSIYLLYLLTANRQNDGVFFLSLKESVEGQILAQGLKSEVGGVCHVYCLG